MIYSILLHDTFWFHWPWSGGSLPLILLVIIIVLLLRRRRTQTTDLDKPAKPGFETPLDILKKRYAQGEISKNDFEQMKKDLET